MNQNNFQYFGEEGGNAPVVGGTHNDEYEEEEGYDGTDNPNNRARYNQLEAVGGLQYDDEGD